MSDKYLTLCRLRLIFATLITGFIIRFVFFNSFYTWITTFVLVCIAAAAVWFGWLPRYLCGYEYEVSGRGLSVTRGVFYRTTESADFTAIKYLTTSSGPLERSLGLCVLTVRSAGARLRLPGLTPKSARELSGRLSEGSAHE